MSSLKKILILACCFITTAAVHAQSDSVLSLTKIINGGFTSFSVDNLDNIYLNTNTGQLKKLNANGDSLAVFNDVKRYGTLAQIDVSNPLKILLYYKNFATIVTLDNYLNVRNTINLRKQNLYTVNAVATSYDNNIWLYDEQEYKLKKMSDDGTILQESNDFRMLFDTVPSAVQLTDHDNFVYLYDTTHGFYSFDYYGNFKNRLPFLHWTSTAVTGKIIYGFSNNKLMSYLQQSLNLKAYQLPAFTNNYFAIKIMNNKLYVLKSEGLYVYLIK